MSGPIRKRLKRRETLGPRYLTFSTYRRLALLGNPKIRDRFAASIATARAATAFRLIAWVVMPEHVHIILVPGDGGPVPRVLGAMKREFAREVLARWRGLRAAVLTRLVDEAGRAHFWQPGGGFDRNIRGEDELEREIAYIHHNPVKRGLVAAPTDWAWSSARWYAGGREGEIAIDLPWGRSLEVYLRGEALRRGDEA